jgi:hypothetical protein
MDAGEEGSDMGSSSCNAAAEVLGDVDDEVGSAKGEALSFCGKGGASSSSIVLPSVACTIFLTAGVSSPAGTSVFSLLEISAYWAAWKGVTLERSRST